MRRAHGADRRQRHAEGGAFAGAGAFGRHAPLVQLDQALHQREADAETALRAVEAALALHEELEDARQELGLDAAAVVLDGNRRQALARGRGQADAARLRGVFAGIVQEVGNGL